MNSTKENELDLESLLAAATIAADEEKEQTIKELDEAQRFILALDIKRGQTRVSALLIYDYYTQWRGKSKKKLRNIPFFKRFSKYFEKYRDKYNTYYLLDPAPFDLSEEKFWEVRKRLRTREALRRRHAKKATGTKPSQEPRSEETLPQSN